MQTTLTPTMNSSKPEPLAPKPKPRILQVESDVVISVDKDGNVPIMAWLVGHEFREGKWERAHVTSAATKAGLDPICITGRNPEHVEEFRRACRAIERASDFQGQRTVDLQVGSRTVGLNAHVVLEVVPIDKMRGGTVFQLNRTLKVFTKNIEDTLAEGILKEDVMTALRALGDTDHAITQNIGKWRLLDDLSIEATLYEGMAQDPAGAAGLFGAMTRFVEAEFQEMTRVYTHQDLRNAWERTRVEMKGSFPFRFGSGGVTFTLAKFHPNLLAWKAFLQELYDEDNFDILPVTSIKEAQEKIHKNGKEWLQGEWDRLVDQTLQSVKRAQAGKPDSLDDKLLKINARLQEKVAGLHEMEQEINTALLDTFRFRSSLSPQKADQLRSIEDPRVRGLMAGAGLIEADDHEMNPPPAPKVPPPTVPQGAPPANPPRMFRGVRET